MRDYFLLFKTYEKGKLISSEEMEACGGSPRVALNRAMTTFAARKGVRAYQLPWGQKLVIDMEPIRKG